MVVIKISQVRNQSLGDLDIITVKNLGILDVIVHNERMVKIRKNQMVKPIGEL